MQLTPSPTTASLSLIPDGKAGIIVTLRAMRNMVRAAKKSLPVRFLALELTRDLESKNWTAEARAIQEYVRDRVRYVKDIRGVETVQSPEKTLELGAGDCDDKSVLSAALLESIGHPTRFVAIGFTPGEFEHVYTQTKIGREWIGVECTEPVSLGWEPENFADRLIIHN